MKGGTVHCEKCEKPLYWLAEEKRMEHVYYTTCNAKLT